MKKYHQHGRPMAILVVRKLVYDTTFIIPHVNEAQPD